MGAKVTPSIDVILHAYFLSLLLFIHSYERRGEGEKGKDGEVTEKGGKKG